MCSKWVADFGSTNKQTFMPTSWSDATIKAKLLDCQAADQDEEYSWQCHVKRNIEK